LEELQLVVRASAEEGAIDPEAEALLRRSIRSGEKTAADALVPRVSITAVDVDATVTELVGLSVATGFSRFPVHRGDIDDIAGVVHVKRVYDLPFDQRSETSVSEIMDEPYAVPETIDLETLLLALRDRMAHLAIVVDEHGGTAGIITVEDLVEEIVGEIDDEHDPRTPQLTVIEGAGEYLLSGALHTDEVREACGFEMPEGDYETLAGFILDRLGHIPEVNEEVTYDGWCLRVLELDRLRISTVRLIPPADPVEVDER
jgi:CBS domain containing-hemolysin-like protein